MAPWYSTYSSSSLISDSFDLTSTSLYATVPRSWWSARYTIPYPPSPIPTRFDSFSNRVKMKRLSFSTAIDRDEATRRTSTVFIYLFICKKSTVFEQKPAMLLQHLLIIPNRLNFIILHNNTCFIQSYTHTYVQTHPCNQHRHIAFVCRRSSSYVKHNNTSDVTELPT